jgi:drug/metabolite transporter (DMT)-like permease
MMSKKVLYADLSLLFVAFIWGTTFVLVQNAIDTLPPFSFNTLRFFIASVCLIFIMKLFNKKNNNPTRLNAQSIISGVFIGALLFAGYAFQTFGLLFTTTSKAAFITGLSVVLVPIFSFIIFKQKVKLFPLLGISIALVGLYLLTMINNFGLQFGDMLVLFCALSFALHIIYTGYFAKKISALTLTATQLITVTVFSGISALLFEDVSHTFSLAVLLDQDVLVAILVTSLLATALAFFIQTVTQQYTSPTKVGIIFAMEPVFAALTALLFTNEMLGDAAIIGCAFIFFGMILAEVPTDKILQRRKTKQA